MGKKGGKKGKKNKGLEGPEPVTTQGMINDRMKMSCPRIGDYYLQNVNVTTILEDVALKLLEKIIANKLDSANLCNLKISSFPRLTNIVDDLGCLTNLNLAKNNLFNADDLFQALSQLRNIRKLDLSNNFLNGKLPEVVSNMAMIEELNMDVNGITALCPGVAYWTNIKIFTISDNSLTELTPECSSWENLQVLNLKNNKITDIGILPKSWPNLERLYAGSNLLNTIPYELGMSTKLKVLDLSANTIQTIPLSLAGCTSLEYLNLGSNKVEIVQPEIIGAFLQLQELHLYKNKIQVLPNEIGTLKHLRKLTLSSNNLKALPDEIGDCTTLEELYVSNNAKFSSFPSTAGHLGRLRELALSKCPALKQLPNTVADCPALTELDIRGVKKQVCKITPEMVHALKYKAHGNCTIRGGVVKKAKGGKKK